MMKTNKLHVVLIFTLVMSLLLFACKKSATFDDVMPGKSSEGEENQSNEVNETKSKPTNTPTAKSEQTGKLYFIYGQSEGGEPNLVLNDTGNIQYLLDAEGNIHTQLSRPIDEIITAGDVVFDSSDVSTAEVVVSNPTGLGDEYIVNLTLNDSGASKFEKATQYAYSYRGISDIRNTIIIVYDGRVISAPSVQSPIADGNASISYQDNIEEAEKLAGDIRNMTSR